MRGVIDEEALQQDELHPDVFVLTEMLKEMSPLLEKSFGMYSDVRKHLVDQSLHKPKLSFSSTTIADIEPQEMSDVGEDSDFYEQVMNFVIKVSAQLKQLAAERAGATEASNNAIAQLRSENKHLSEQLSRYRKREFLTSDEGVSYSSGPITPRSVSKSGSRIVDSPESPKVSSSPPFSPVSIVSPARRSQRTLAGKAEMDESMKKVTFSPRPDGK